MLKTICAERHICQPPLFDRYSISHLVINGQTYECNGGTLLVIQIEILRRNIMITIRVMDIKDYDGIYDLWINTPGTIDKS